MDPLSFTASIISVATLSTKLGQSALDIKRLLNTISNAPSEIVRLKDVITQLHSIADSIKIIINQEKITHGQESFCSENILHALATCQEKLDLIENTVRRAAQASKERALVSRSWEQLRIACKKEQIEEFEKQLGRAINILNMTFLLDLIHSKGAMNSAVEKIAQNQYSNYKDIAHLQHEVGYLLRKQQLTVSRGAMPLSTSPSSSKRSVFKTWSYSKGFKVQYQGLSGRKERYVLMLQARVFESWAIFAQFSWPSTPSTISWNLAVRNLMPDDAAIVKACSLGDCECVRELLATGAARPNDITANNATPLGVAIKAGSEEIVQLLLREGADPNLPCGDFDASPTQIAVKFEKPSIARMLVQHGADLEYISRGWSILHHFFTKGKFTANTEYFSIFEDYLTFDDVKDSDGWTSLHRCAAYGTAEDVHNMHHLGASVHIDRYITNGGLNPLHVAAMMNNVVTLDAFTSSYRSRPTILGPTQVSVGILNAVDFHGWTPLHHAVFMQAKETTKWLLHNGANPYCRTYSTATWFPDGHEKEAFETDDLAKLLGKEFLQYYVENLREVGYDVTTDGEDVYWSLGDD